MPKKSHVKKLREEIEKKLGIKTARIYEKAKALATSAQTKTEDGIYLLAAQSGTNLNKYLPQDKVNQIRQLLFQLNRQVQPAQSVKSPKEKPKFKMVSVNIGRAFKLKDPLLTEKVLTEAKVMAGEVYPLLYVFENSVREMIVRVMQKVHGPNWWELKVSKDIQEEVQRRKAREDKNPWHGKRGAHPIYYTDLEHLGRILQNNWTDFKDILPTQQWLIQRLDEISHSRNPVAHMNPLNRHDIQRIKVYFRDWEKHISAKRALIA